MKDLDLITDWYYHKLNIEMSQLGMLKKEKNGIPVEQSLLLEKVFKMLGSQGMDKERIAKQMFLPASELDKLVFGLLSPLKNVSSPHQTALKLAIRKT